MFYDRLQMLCKEQGTSVSAMLKELGLSTGSTGNWKKGQLPKGDVLLKIANYLQTSIDFIVTGSFRSNLTQEEQYLLTLYRSIPERAQYKAVCDFERIADEERRKVGLNDENNDNPRSRS